MNQCMNERTNEQINESVNKNVFQSLFLDWVYNLLDKLWPGWDQTIKFMGITNNGM